MVREVGETEECISIDVGGGGTELEGFGKWELGRWPERSLEVMEIGSQQGSLHLSMTITYVDEIVEIHRNAETCWTVQRFDDAFPTEFFEHLDSFDR